MKGTDAYYLFAKSVWYLGAPMPWSRCSAVGELCLAISIAGDYSDIAIAETHYAEMQSALRTLVRYCTSHARRHESRYFGKATSGGGYSSFGRSLKSGFLTGNGTGPFKALEHLASAARCAGELTLADASESDTSYMASCAIDYWMDTNEELRILCAGTLKPTSLFVSLGKTTGVLDGSN